MPAFFARHIQAAGGVVLRDGHVCVVHRPAHGDWSLPKGKLNVGESHEDAAIREVHEETGLRCTLGAPLRTEQITDRKGRPKTVRWWIMSMLGDDGLIPGLEVDERRWVAVDDADRLLHAPHDRVLVRDAVRLTGRRTP